MRNAKWYAKTVLRSALGAVGAVATPFRDGPAMHVLMYHRIDDDPGDPFSIPPARFERQLDYLAEHCDVLDIHRYLSYVRGEATLDRPSILITFDDGYRSLVEHALPRLRDRRLPALLFASTREIDRSDSSRTDDRHLDWDEVRALRAGGIDIGSHGWRHVPLAGLTPSQQTEELERSVRLLDRHVPDWVAAFAYPYGIAGTFDRGTESRVRALGFECSFRAQHGSVRPGCAYLAPRTKVDQADPAWLFGPSIRGALDTWAIVDRLGSRAQRSGVRID